jgi:hypothetical protein
MHAAYGRVWQMLETAIGSSISVHFFFLALIAVVIALATASRWWAQCSFMINHLAVIAVAISSLASAQARVSSLTADLSSTGDWAATWVAHLSPVQTLLLLGGVASCMFCHAAVLKSQRTDRAFVSLRIRMLQQNL